MGFNFRKTARTVLGVILAVVTLLAGNVTAQATQVNGMPGYYSNPGSSGTAWSGYHGFVLGW